MHVFLAWYSQFLEKKLWIFALQRSALPPVRPRGLPVSDLSFAVSSSRASFCRRLLSESAHYPGGGSLRQVFPVRGR